MRKTDIDNEEFVKTLDNNVIIYQNLINFMVEGVAFHQLISNENNQPVDYIIENINNQYLKHIFQY